jgi:nicotinamidase-related amidase
MAEYLGRVGVVLLVGSLLSCGAFAEQARELADCDTALIVINLDSVTMGFAGSGPPFPEDWRTVNDRHVVEANVDLIREARGAGVLIVHLYGDYESSVEEGPPTFPEEIAPHDDILIGRPGRNLDVFLNTILLETLQSHGIRNLLFSGVNTGYCITRSAQMGVRLGFDVTVVADAHSGGTPTYAQTYNDYWPTKGIAVVSTCELDFTALCAPTESPESAEG